MNPLLQIKEFAVASLIAAAPVDDSLSVRVVDEQGQPVAGAWVACGWSRLFEELVEIGPLREWIECGGKGVPHGVEGCVATDAGGVARVRASDPWNDCVAITPTHGARVIVAHGSVRELELRLAPHRWWRVRLTEPDGSPARCAVPIALLSEVDDGAAPRFTWFGSMVPRDGIATFGPLEFLFDPDEIDPELFVRPGLPCLTPPRLRCRASQITAEPMALPLPPYGSFELRVVEQDGSLARRPVTIGLSSNEFSQLGLPGPYFETWRKQQRVVAGVCIVEPIGLALAMRLDVADQSEEADGGGITSRALTATGVQPPLVRHGERRVLTLAAPPVGGAGELVVAGRLVGSDGRPLARRSLEIELIDPRSGETIGWCSDDRWKRFESDGEGRFGATLAHRRALPGEAQLLVIDHGAADGLDSGARAYALLPVPVTADPSDEVVATYRRNVDLADVPLLELPRLAGGVVVDSSGAAAAGVALVLDDEATAEQKPDRTIPAWWRERGSVFRVVSDRDGRFDVRGFAGATTWGLRSFGRLGSGEIALVVGRDDQRLELMRDDASLSTSHGAIAGRLLLDPEVPGSELAVSIALEQGAAPTKTGRDAASLGFGDRFEGGQLTPGRYAVVVQLVTFGQPPAELARVAGVEVRAGAVSLVPPIDLRGRIRVARLTLVDRDGELVPAGHVFSREQTAWPREAGNRPLAEQPDHARFRDGTFTVCTAAEWAPLEFLGLGCRRRIVRLEASGELTLVLPPPRRVRLLLPSGIALPEAPLTLDASMYTEQLMSGVMYLHGGAPPNGGSASFGHDGVAELELPAAAKYKLSVCAARQTVTTNGSRYSGYSVIDDVQIEVDDSDEPLVIELLEVTQAAVDFATRRVQ